MRRLATLALILAFAAPAAAQDYFLREYATATTINFCLYETDGLLLEDAAAHAAGDTVIMLDDGTPGNTANAFVDEGTCYSLALSSGETTAARVVITISDQTAPQVWLDKHVIVETYGNASAQYEYFPSNVTAWAGNAATASSGNPDVNVESMDAGVIDATVVADATIDRATFAVDTGLQSIRSNTAQAGAAGSITLDASASATTDYYAGTIVFLTSNTGVGQFRNITAYNGSTKVATVVPNWATNPASGTTFAVMADGSANVTAWRRAQPNTLVSSRVDSSTGAMAANVVTAAAINAGAIAASEFDQTAADKVWSSTTRTVSAATNITSTGGTTVPQTGDSFARLGAPAGASVSADVAAVKGETAAILDDTGTSGVEVASISGSTLAANKLQASILTLITGAAATGTLTTTVATTDLSGYANDQLIDRVIYWTSGALEGEIKTIADYASSSGTITVGSAWTTSPSNGDTFVIY